MLVGVDRGARGRPCELHLVRAEQGGKPRSGRERRRGEDGLAPSGLHRRERRRARACCQQGCCRACCQRGCRGVCRKRRGRHCSRRGSARRLRRRRQTRVQDKRARGAVVVVAAAAVLEVDIRGTYVRGAVVGLQKLSRPLLLPLLFRLLCGE